jgi:hypothetical protein
LKNKDGLGSTLNNRAMATDEELKENDGTLERENTI